MHPSLFFFDQSAAFVRFQCLLFDRHAAEVKREAVRRKIKLFMLPTVE
jgi:hypothetical protein